MHLELHESAEIEPLEMGLFDPLDFQGGRPEKENPTSRNPWGPQGKTLRDDEDKIPSIPRAINVNVGTSHKKRRPSFGSLAPYRRGPVLRSQIVISKRATPRDSARTRNPLETWLDFCGSPD